VSFIYPSKSLSRCFESVVSIIAFSYILTDASAIGELIGVDKSIVAARAVPEIVLELRERFETDV
jgi:hypothetical protein